MEGIRYAFSSIDKNEIFKTFGYSLNLNIAT